jgi:glycosyltransferase involved in cell wall biosynthesis
MPAISVVMPVYNRAQTVQRAISSVQRQTCTDFEIVVVDDGSKDNTQEVVRAIHDPRIRLLVQPENRGGNAARNRGIREASSEIICFLDSDDEFLPHKLDTVQRYFAEHPDVDALLDSFQLLYPPEKGGGTKKRTNPHLQSSAAVEEAIYSRRLFKATPALSARKPALLKIGLFDEALRRRQDMDLVLRLAAGCEMRSISEVLWTKYWTEGAISSKQETFMRAMLDMCERYPAYLVQPQFRRGLARDFTRHFLRLGLNGRASTIRKDMAQFSSRHGRVEAILLFTQGLWEMARRAISRG